jgi:hypothetical protein
MLRLYARTLVSSTPLHDAARWRRNYSVCHDYAIERQEGISGTHERARKSVVAIREYSWTGLRTREVKLQYRCIIQYF